MSSDSNSSVPGTNVSPSLFLVNRFSKVSLKKEGSKILLILPKEETELTIDWSKVWQELKYRLNTSERFWQPGTAVDLIANNLLLDGRQLQIIAEVLREADLHLKLICTSRRQTAVAAATAGYSVKQESPSQSLASSSPQGGKEWAEPLYLRTTLRSGMEVRHPGTVVLLGDLNPGATVIAAGDILVWGCLRGIAHAGAQGNRECRIMALRMEPTQLRIADSVARAPEAPPHQFEPEVAYITPEGIRLAQAINFAKLYSFSSQVGGWIDSKNE
ncbi:MAG: septum site-determining protein MinC [Prochloraceae cyanobacterium]